MIKLEQEEWDAAVTKGDIYINISSPTNVSNVGPEKVNIVCCIDDSLGKAIGSWYLLPDGRLIETDSTIKIGPWPVRDKWVNAELDKIKTRRVEGDCIGSGGKDVGCGYVGISGEICPNCNGMILSKAARSQARELAKLWNQENLKED